MAESWRAIRLLAATAWQADRRLTVAVAAEPLGNTLGLLAGLWLAMLTTGTIRHDNTLLVLGAAGLVAGAGLGWQLDLSSSQWRMVLSEKMTRAFEIENAQLAAALPGLEHQESPEYQAKLELLRQRQGQLGAAMSMLAVAYKAVCGGAVVFILLVLAHPLLLGLVVLALPAVVIARHEQRWRQAAEEACALPSRTARHLRALAYDRDAGMEVRVFGLADELEDRAARAWADYRRPVQRAERRVALVTFARESLTGAGVVAAIGFELWQVANGRATPGEAILVIYVSRQVQSAVAWPIQAVGSVGQTLRTAGRFLWLRDYAASVASRYAGRCPAPAALGSGIEFDNVSFRYPGTDTWILRRVSVTLPAGSVLAVVGENGAGKTTLVKLLTRMYEPTEGRILVDGVNLADIDIASWRQRLSAAFQDFAKLEFTVQRTVGTGDLAWLDDEGHVLGALERAGAAEELPTLPAGTATQLGVQWDGVDLSAGQWQKLALGRALMRTEPLVVFFDEPTAAVDAPTEHALFERYAAASRGGLERGMITILVSHRFSTVSAADRVLVLADQQVAEYGTHDELVAAGRLYAELYDLQARSYRT
ncbi:MAG TPA: ABC transporter ATP-binding protein [Streptosporangiaceae bacterium]|jgi:ATP-binding cassette subfamily B protein